MAVPFQSDMVNEVLRNMHIARVGDATIRQTVALSEEIERRTGEKFIHLEMGSPGLPPSRVGIEAQKEALDSGVPSAYPNISGITPLKQEASRFIKAFLNIDVNPEGCVPTVGSMMGTFASFILTTHLNPEKDTILFINPGFSVQPLQAKVLGYKRESFDIYDCRGEKLRDKLEEILSGGHIAAMIYSNPNNPSWVCLTEEELQYIGALATKYDAIVIEDLAYLGMDFRKDLGHPYEPPYQATVARYTSNYILMLSASKIFSYAGQRIALACISDKLFDKQYPALAQRYEDSGIFGPTFIASIMYMITSGCTATTQYAMAEMLNKSVDGVINFVEDTREYERRARRMKQIFTDNGFSIVYDYDVRQKVGDGFFFTLGYPGMTGGELLEELMYYGVSSISLSTTGSDQQGVRACTSRMREELYPVLEERMKAFKADHPI